MDGLASKIHKWLALLMAVQILFWFVGGLVFAIFPIERVRSEHAIAETAAPPIAFGTAADGLLRLGSAGASAERIEIRTLLGRPVALLISGKGPTRLHDLTTGRPISPLSPQDAARIAEADHRGVQRASRVERVTAASTEYRGALPAWRVDFADGANRSLYVAADSGIVTARRSTLWRAYDFLWGLHIIDWRNHEDFNHPLLIAATLLGLVVMGSGILLLPGRLGFIAWLRRRRSASRD